MPASRTRPLFLIDIAVPRDVDPRAGEIEQVFLYNIDDLQAIVRENLEKRGAEVGRAEQIVEEEVEKFTTWQRSREAVPTIVALRRRFESIRRSELERLEPKLAALPPDARARVEEITRLLVEKLLLQPTEQLKKRGRHPSGVAVHLRAQPVVWIVDGGDEEEKANATEADKPWQPFRPKLLEPSSVATGSGGAVRCTGRSVRRGAPRSASSSLR